MLTKSPLNSILVVRSEYKIFLKSLANLIVFKCLISIFEKERKLPRYKYDNFAEKSYMIIS